MLCNTKFDIHIQKLQRNPQSIFQKGVKKYQ